MTIRPSVLFSVLTLLAGNASSGLQAAPLVANLNTGTMSSSQFNSLFTPMASAPTISAGYQFLTTPTSGTVESQVFQGTGAAAGLYAYAYQFVVNPVVDSSGQPTSLNSASIQFNGPAIGTNLIGGSGGTYWAYTVSDGAVGGIGASQAGAGGSIQAPSSITYMTGATSQSLTFQFLNPKTGAGPLEAGARSATIVVISTLPFTTQVVSLQNANPQISYPVAYSAQSTTVPEPTTLLGWAGLIAGGAMMHRRRNRASSR